MTDRSNELISLIFATKRRMLEKFRQDSYKITPSMLQLETLRFVQEKQQPLMKEVAEFLCITPPSATSLINDLVEDGMILRLTSENDRRSIRITITQKGEGVLENGIKQISQSMAKNIAKLNQDEQEQLILILNKFNQIN
ncbi:MAG: MarR family transcriptional regulator [Candidatus Falkowbacteria bacterium]